MTWQAPQIGDRPILVLGAGVLGRRIACSYLAGGYNVNTYEPSAEVSEQAGDYIKDHVNEFKTPEHHTPGTWKSFDDLTGAAKEAWLVIEAVPEKLQLKIDTFGELDQKTPKDCILGSNSSSYRSSLMVEKVSPERKKMICNVHYSMPPTIRTVELMTDGETHPEVFPFLTEILKRCGMIPCTARKESTGFIFNRLWAAVKREIMMMLAEDVSDASQIDLLWAHMFQAKVSPCKLMDQIGLDTVAFIEDNYIQELHLDSTLTVDWLRKNYLDKGKKGLKSDKGGLYPPAEAISSSSSGSLLVLDVGLGSNAPSLPGAATNGKILRLDPSTGKSTVVVKDQNLPDGIDVSESTGRMFWTNMGHSTSGCDGSVMSAKLDGSDMQTLVPAGEVHTPKQLVVVDKQKKVYFCDREGMGVHRCDLDGKTHEVLVQRKNNKETIDQTQWCVGISVDVDAGKVYWTQKGDSKAGQGRIFRAKLDMPAGETAENRSDIELLLENLPEPIDLELDLDNQLLYWTDRGEHPTGCALYRAPLAALGKGAQPELLARQFHEPIGLKVDAKRDVAYVNDLGGSVYTVDLVTKEKKVIRSDDGCYTGLALVA